MLGAAVKVKAKPVNYLNMSSVKAVSENVSPLTMACLRKDTTLRVTDHFFKDTT